MWATVVSPMCASHTHISIPNSTIIFSRTTQAVERHACLKVSLQYLHRFIFDLCEIFCFVSFFCFFFVSTTKHLCEITYLCLVLKGRERERDKRRGRETNIYLRENSTNIISTKICIYYIGIR